MIHNILTAHCAPPTHIFYLDCPDIRRRQVFKGTCLGIPLNRIELFKI